MPVVSLVEGQEYGVFAGEFGGHEDEVVRDGEVDEGAPGGQEGAVCAGLAVVLVLADRVVDGLGVVGLEFHRDDGDAVGAQDDVDGLVGGGVEADLTHDAQADGVRGFGDFDQLGVRGREFHHGAELGGGAADLGVGEAGPQDAEKASHGFPCRVDAGRFTQFLGQVGEEVSLGFVSLPVREVRGDRLVVFVRVLGGQPVEHVAGDEGEAQVPARGAGVSFVLVEPAALAQFGADGGFEFVFEELIVAHAGTFFRPVTTSVMRAARRSTRRALSSATLASMASIRPVTSSRWSAMRCCSSNDISGIGRFLALSDDKPGIVAPSARRPINPLE